MPAEEAKMTGNNLWCVGFGLICFGFSATAHADETLRCGEERLVEVGYSAYDVTARCGAPDWVEHRFETRTVSRPVLVPCRMGRCTVYIQDTIQVPIEEWTYDFGPQRFVYYLTFEQGRLLRIVSGSYGYKQ